MTHPPPPRSPGVLPTASGRRAQSAGRACARLQHWSRQAACFTPNSSRRGGVTSTCVAGSKRVPWEGKVQSEAPRACNATRRRLEGHLCRRGVHTWQRAGSKRTKQSMATGQALALVDPRFCMNSLVELVLRERAYGWTGDDFDILDQNGTVFFKLSAAPVSFSERRVLRDCYGHVVVTMKKKLATIHGTWLMYRGDSDSSANKIAEVKPHLVALSPSVDVYLNDGDKEPDFKLRGNFRAKKFSISQVVSGSKVLVAEVKKESRFSSVTAYLRAKFTDAQIYFLDIQPGVDVAFVTALATLLDEIFHDQRPSQ